MMASAITARKQESKREGAQLKNFACGTVRYGTCREDDDVPHLPAVE